ncbi:hypothetical protein DPMN_178310 [Dreissena polymorpha]|uniref:Secreted protein n=1 Tax=Dreissena polymorpha TaxID=45954 RepID=A0A9D4EDX5_DREPO|nr:hypothetical protein DPMN_178310 [Dreissena polymorpha]
MNPPRFFLQIFLGIPWSCSASGLNMAIYFHPVHCIHPSMWVTAGLHACRPPCQANLDKTSVTACSAVYAKGRSQNAVVASVSARSDQWSRD